VSKYYKKRSVKSGLPPGTLVHIGEKRLDAVKIQVFDYNENDFREIGDVKTMSECLALKENPTVTWVNVDGVHDTDVLESFGQAFGIHPLILEDIMNTDQRPKMQEFDDYIYVVLKNLKYDENGGERGIVSEQVSMVITSKFVITFQENKAGDAFNPVRDLIRSGKGKIRKMGSDFLTYALIDAIVDGYFGVLEKTGERMEEIEEEMMANPTFKTLHLIHILKREMLLVRRAVWPLRELIVGLERSDSDLIKSGTKLYLQDVYDHTIQLIESTEIFRDMLSEILNIYLSSVGNKTNMAVRRLTLITTVFMPLTLLAGIGGMSEFTMMTGGAENWKIAYSAFFLIMAVIASCNYYVLKWLDKRDKLEVQPLEVKSDSK
jgi:magnesium transporter